MAANNSCTTAFGVTTVVVDWLVGCSMVASFRAGSGALGWGDVLVHPEQVGRVVSALERDEPFVVRPVGGANLVPAVVCGVAEIVDVDPVGQERPQRPPKRPRPFDVGL